MKKLEAVNPDVQVLQNELLELETFLSLADHLKERKEIIPFFKARNQLTAALGILNAQISSPQLYANELQLFGDFAADAASGDKDGDAVALIEFEDANEFSIFSKLGHGKTIKSYSPRFEHGFSQLVDWAWRLSSELNSDHYARIFGSKMVHISYMIIIGRDSDLSDEDLLRLRWRTRNVMLTGVSMQCFTFDEVLSTLRRRIAFANATPIVIP